MAAICQILSLFLEKNYDKIEMLRKLGNRPALHEERGGKSRQLGSRVSRVSGSGQPTVKPQRRVP
jgi:hypothetical protein